MQNDNPVDLPFCGKCRLQHDPAVECLPIALTWWQSGPWKPPPHRELAPAADHYDERYMPTFNPACKHDRCCYTLCNCDACIRYTKDLWEARARAKLAVDVEPKK